jgi:hypothetical protein
MGHGVVVWTRTRSFQFLSRAVERLRTTGIERDISVFLRLPSGFSHSNFRGCPQSAVEPAAPQPMLLYPSHVRVETRNSHTCNLNICGDRICLLHVKTRTLVQDFDSFTASKLSTRNGKSRLTEDGTQQGSCNENGYFG